MAVPQPAARPEAKAEQPQPLSQAAPVRPARNRQFISGLVLTALLALALGYLFGRLDLHRSTDTGSLSKAVAHTGVQVTSSKPVRLDCTTPTVFDLTASGGQNELAGGILIAPGARQGGTYPNAGTYIAQFDVDKRQHLAALIVRGDAGSDDQALYPLLNPGGGASVMLDGATYGGHTHTVGNVRLCIEPIPNGS